MRFFAASLVVLALAACTEAEKARELPPLRPLRAGAGEALINLPVGHSTAGYAQSEVLAYQKPKNDPGSPFADLFPATRGVQSAPKAKAVLLDNGQTVFALVRIDAIFTTDVLVARATELAAERLGLDLRGKLLVNATHTHDAGCRFATSMVVELLETERGWRQDAIGHGVDSFNPDSLNRVAGSIVNAIGAAQAAMKPAALGYARTESTDGSRDRRCQDDALYGKDKIDRDIRLIRIDEVDEETGETTAPLAVLVNFAMHGTVYGDSNRNLSVDAPGLVEYKLEERFAERINVLYMQGAAGDVSPGGAGDGSQRMEDVGYRVAAQAHALYNAVTGGAEAAVIFPLSREVPIRVAARRIPLRHDLLGYADDEFFKDGAMLCAVGVNDECPAPDASGNPVDVPPLSTTSNGRCVGVGVEGKGKYHTDLMVAQVGPLTIASVPGEPVAEIGRRVAAAGKELGLNEVLVYGYAQDHNGYILMPDDWLRGGYEPTITEWGWKFAPYMLEQQADLMRELATGAPAKKYAVPRVKYPDVTTPPTPAVPGREMPVLRTAPEGAHARFSALTVAWYGGDPVLGLPRVGVEVRQGGKFVPLRYNGWRPVNNAGYEIQTQYSSDPSYATFKTRRDIFGEDIVWGEGKWVPSHQWSARWEVPAWAPAGEYRLRVMGTYVGAVDGEPVDYDLATEPFTVAPAVNLATGNPCDADGNGSLDSSQDYFTVTTDPTGLTVRLTGFYPQAEPVWDEVFNGGGHQTGNFRLWSERGTARYPVAGALQGKVKLKKDGTVVAEADLVWHEPPGTGKLAPLCPNKPDAPHAEAKFTWNGSGTYEAMYDAGDVSDAYGNALTAAVSAAYIR